MFTLGKTFRKHSLEKSSSAVVVMMEEGVGKGEDKCIS